MRHPCATISPHPAERTHPPWRVPRTAAQDSPTSCDVAVTSLQASMAQRLGDDPHSWANFKAVKATDYHLDLRVDFGRCAIA